MRLDEMCATIQTSSPSLPLPQITHNRKTHRPKHSAATKERENKQTANSKSAHKQNT